MQFWKLLKLPTAVCNPVIDFQIPALSRNKTLSIFILLSLFWIIVLEFGLIEPRLTTWLYLNTFPNFIFLLTPNAQSCDIWFLHLILVLLVLYFAIENHRLCQRCWEETRLCSYSHSSLLQEILVNSYLFPLHSSLHANFLLC